MVHKMSLDSQVNKAERGNPDKVREALNTIPHSGPNRIIETLDSLDPNNLDIFYKALTSKENQAPIGQMMYFWKYLKKNLPGAAKEIERIAISNHKEYINQNETNVLTYALARLSPEERKIILPHVGAIQTKQGCGGECIMFCGFDAVPGVRDKTPIAHINTTLEQMAQEGAKPPEMWWADDLLQVTEDPRKFLELANKYHELFSTDLLIQTSIPYKTNDVYVAAIESPVVKLLVSLNDHNIKRLKREGITKVGSLDEIETWDKYKSQGEYISNPETLNEIFREGYVPAGVNLKYKENLSNVGVNRDPKKDNSSGTEGNSGITITPYAVLNIIVLNQASDEHPQSNVVVALDALSDGMINMEKGTPIDPYLTNVVITKQKGRWGRNIEFQVANLASKADVAIDYITGNVIECNSYTGNFPTRSFTRF